MICPFVASRLSSQNCFAHRREPIRELVVVHLQHLLWLYGVYQHLRQSSHDFIRVCDVETSLALRAISYSQVM